MVLAPVSAERLDLEQNKSLENDLRFEFEGCTYVIPCQESSSDLTADTIEHPEELLIPTNVQKYDLVTFDHTTLNKKVRSILPLRINGTTYDTTLARMNFEQIDDGIDSYEGTIQGMKNSNVLITISDDAIIGSVTLGDETFWIIPVEPHTRTEEKKSPLHIIYSSKDVKDSEPVMIDEGPLPAPSGVLSSTAVREILDKQKTTDRDQIATVNILLATDNGFYNFAGTNWKVTAQDIIATANQHFGRDDIKVSLCVAKYDDSKRYDLSNDQRKTTYPLQMFKDHFPPTYLNDNSADIALYLGGYDKNDGIQGLAWGFRAEHIDYRRYAWAQMVKDDAFYTGSQHGRRCISIHELGHIFDANHENTGGDNQAYSWWDLGLYHRTVMWSNFVEGANTYEFSSDNYHGDATHDNAKSIQAAKLEVKDYAQIRC
ncbi:M12 family metallo-peptidase [Methanofollis formosanus]|nr:M12 family metallo-peptidase [Methanofollis formosanus]